ncbi:hypothetical protein Nepgr_006981 [Nepenthes gracilis]|uniref:F-box domain-containing protein n=1 Tax=Nepenthes gracilis TaxID=150966 RepID=A0AAD3S6A5_NEPGR|nr:hypothetical protein Nepgr_006981 [Nepenthes gracilis]
MASVSPSTNSTFTKITDLDEDSLAHCARYLSPQDLSNMAMTCKLLKRVAYHDSIWLRFFREQWPQQISFAFSQASGVREAYLGRHTAVQKFQFVDPLIANFYIDARPFSHVLLGKNDIIFSRGSFIHILKIDDFVNGKDCLATLTDHKARITCMRLFAINDASFFRSETQRSENVLVTSSCDHSIRLWWKGSCQRCFRGHSAPVSTLSDRLLADGSSNIFASGGEDGTVRLWSLGTSGKCGQHALKATLYGHQKPVKWMSVAGHKTSLLVTIATDSKIRVWDSTMSSSARSSCCVGMASVSGAPIGIKCHESMVYVAAGSSVVTIDLRTMKVAFTAAICQSQLYSFDILPSKSLVCAGESNRALLWDVRKSQEAMKPEPMSMLDGHNGPVTHVHMDPYKIVTGGPYDFYANIWDVETGLQTNSLICSDPERSNASCGCNAMAVDGCRIVTACSGEEGLVRFRDFTNASCSVSSYEDELGSKFWSKTSYSDTDSDV